MWDSINFKGYFEQIVYSNIKEVNGITVPIIDPETGYWHGSGRYNAFDREDLIPSLVSLVKRVNRKGRQSEECLKWIKENGFLTLPRYMLPANGQSLEMFWTEAKALTNLWDMYRQAVNRDIEALKSYTKISIEHLSVDEIKNEEFLWGKGNDGRVCVSGLFEGETAFGIMLKEIEKDPIAPYQFAVLQYIVEKVTYYIGNLHIKNSNLVKHSGSDKDSFTIDAYLVPATLLQAMYLQFLQILTEKRKVCPACWVSFTPKRKDQVFCKPGCRYTNHTRIRRNPENKKGGLTNGRLGGKTQ
ncbi:MAG: hypothetical protein ACYC0Q_05905 [Eubacteriales bacterium]